ncbi:TonB-dependent siderophore receptor [Oxalicibacterium solurbis]|uniref:TonB-dependent siderophore receptor n=1 Tax=Oxalicibacterium solurbis TaxID=69280 RepID=A0A8J3F504_9BURK|nr:TonB-dependent siderophore receptor [Oxalicibacterium solurbis]GGI55022.1 hypothetical protein GCM10011430_21960 [Oxalicibacterium solurbis]
MLYRKSLPLAVALACAAMASTAFAQQQDTPADAAGNAAGNAVTTLPAVNVTATLDATTEKSDSYAAHAVTVGTKTPQSLRETPFSVSVVTRQRLDDQNLTTIEDALKQTTGVTIQRFDGAGNFNTIQSRGFNIGSIQLDGIPISQDGNYATGFDTAIYDRVELLRGPAGLLQGAGEPGGTVNLARKRAQAQLGGSANLQYGSWDAQRAEIDVTGALNESGTVRGRIVGLTDKRDSFVDIVKSDKELFYGTLEVDLTSRTTLSLGATKQKINAVLDQGLPTHADGRLIDFSRATFAGTDSNDQDTESSDMFAELEHRLDNGGLLKVTARQVDREMEYYGGRSSTPVGGTNFIDLQTSHYKRETRNRNLDAYVTTPFELGGRQHQLLLGASYSTEEAMSVYGSGGPTSLNIFNPDYGTPLPAVPLGPYNSETKQTQKGLYGQVQLKPMDDWTFLLGGRFSKYETEARNPITGVPGKGSDPGTKFQPLVAAIYALDKNSSLYASYAETFVGQSAQDKNQNILSPRTGSQIELGINSEWMNKRINTHLAIFQIIDKDRAITDPSEPTASIAGGKVRSQGFEAEISGQVRSGRAGKSPQVMPTRI